MLNQFSQHARVIALIKNVTADNDIKRPHPVVAAGPGQMKIGNSGQLIKRSVVIQKGLAQGMIIAGGYVGTAPLQHQTGKPQPATQLKNAAVADIYVRGSRGEHLTGRPQLTKQAPTGRTDTDPRGIASGIGKLKMVFQCANLPLQIPDADI